MKPVFWEGMLISVTEKAGRVNYTLSKPAQTSALGSANNVSSQFITSEKEDSTGQVIVAGVGLMNSGQPHT